MNMGTDPAEAKAGAPGAAPGCAVSVIIVSWNVRELLLRCLASVRSATATADYEILVVDNDSSDGSAEVVRNAFPSVRLIESRANLGFPGGCNLGAANSRGRTLFFLNPDTELKPGALDMLSSFLVNRPEAAAAGAKLLWPDGSYQDSCRRNFGVFFSILEVIEFHYYFPRNALAVRAVYGPGVFAEPAPVDWLVGAAFAVRREAFEAAGGFDESFFMYAEDADLCRRLAASGGGIWFVPGAEVVHYKARSSGQSDVRAVAYYKSLYRYHVKHSGAFKALLFRAALALWSSVYLLALAAKLPFCRDRAGCRARILARAGLLKWSLIKWT